MSQKLICERVYLALQDLWNKSNFWWSKYWIQIRARFLERKSREGRWKYEKARQIHVRRQSRTSAPWSMAPRRETSAPWCMAPTPGSISAFKFSRGSIVNFFKKKRSNCKILGPAERARRPGRYNHALETRTWTWLNCAAATCGPDETAGARGFGRFWTTVWLARRRGKKPQIQRSLQA